MPPRGDLVLGADLNCSELGRVGVETACSDQAAIARWCGAVRNTREHSNQRTMARWDWPASPRPSFGITPTAIRCCPNSEASVL